MCCVCSELLVTHGRLCACVVVLLLLSNVCVMKGSYVGILRLVVAMVAGVFLIVFPRLTVRVLVYATGVLLVVAGVVHVLRYVSVRRRVVRHRGNAKVVRWPVVPALCVVVGVVVVVAADAVVGVFPVMVGAGLVWMGLWRLYVRWRRGGGVGVWRGLVPMLMLVLGLFVVVNPLAVVDSVLVVLCGVCCVVYCADEVLRMTAGV